MKKLFHVIGLPLLFVASQFFMTIIATIIFLFINNRSDLETWIGTDDYVNSLARFFSTYNIIIVISLFLIFFPILHCKYQKEVKAEKKQIPNLNFLFLIILGLSFSLLYNSILGNLNSILKVTNLFEGTTNILIALITTVFLGPILEEYLFRGIVYHRLQKYNKVMKSILLTGLIFALSHTNIFQVIYAFIFNFILIFVYEKYNLKGSIIVHVSANLASLLFTIFIYPNMFLMELSLAIASLLLIGSYIEIKEM